jgi:hypothetical protein
MSDTDGGSTQARRMVSLLIDGLRYGASAGQPLGG